jgi:hypothetical protein
MVSFGSEGPALLAPLFIAAESTAEEEEAAEVVEKPRVSRIPRAPQ